MTPEQITLTALLGVVFTLLIQGRVRYDLVAFSALVAAVLLGLVPKQEAFAGFGHPAVIVIALVLIISRGLSNAGAVALIAGRLTSADRGVPGHIAVMSVVGAGLSSIINNVAALALLMPLDVDAARKAGRSAAATLMPLSFATILGGMITLIGTPPNIVIAQYREQAMGAPFGMFDFAPVGLAVAVCGVAFVAAVGWRLLPSRADKSGSDAPDAGLYVAELRVGAQDLPDDATLDALRAAADEADVALLGLIRGGRRLHGFGRGQPLHAEDVVVVEGEPDAIEAFASKRGLSLLQDEDHKPELTGGGLRLVEAIVPEGARVSGRSARGLRLFDRLGVTLLGVSRQGRRVRQRVRSAAVRPGDVLLLLGPSERMADATAWLGALPLEGRNRGVAQHRRTWTAIALFGAAVAAAVAGVTDLTVALAACCAAYAALGLVDGTEVYEAVEWKVIVLLACLIPLGQAFERSGAAGLAADGVVALTAGLPTWTALLALMVLTMTLSDFLNNVATALIAAPVGVGIATATGANPDAFLMGVAVASSCAFLTPIGHKNNTIVMGPGGYRFGDYWRMGLPLELLVLAVATPTILLVWPL